MKATYCILLLMITGHAVKADSVVRDLPLIVDVYYPRYEEFIKNVHDLSLRKPLTGAEPEQAKKAAVESALDTLESIRKAMECQEHFPSKSISNYETMFNYLFDVITKRMCNNNRKGNCIGIEQVRVAQKEELINMFDSINCNPVELKKAIKWFVDNKYGPSNYF